MRRIIINSYGMRTHNACDFKQLFLEMILVSNSQVSITHALC